MSRWAVLVSLGTAVLIACAGEATRAPGSPDGPGPSVASASPSTASVSPVPSAVPAPAPEPEPQCELPTRPVPPALRPSLSWVAPPSAASERAIRTFRIWVKPAIMSVERYERGIAGLTRLLRRTRRASPDRPSLIRRLGDAYFDFAQFALEKAERTDDARVWCEMLAVYERALAQCVEALMQCATEYPGSAYSVLALYLSGYVAEVTGHPAEARARYRQAVESAKSSRRYSDVWHYAQFGLAELMLIEAGPDQSKWAEAIRLYGLVPGGRKGKGSHIYRLARQRIAQIQWALGKRDAALRTLSKASLCVHPDQSPCQRRTPEKSRFDRLAQSYNAREAIRRLEQRWGNQRAFRHAVLQRLSAAYQDLGRLQDARAVLEYELDGEDNPVARKQLQEQIAAIEAKAAGGAGE